MGKSANLAIGRSTLIHTGRSNQYPRFIGSGDRLSSTPCDRINIGELSDRANYPIGQIIRSGDRQICCSDIVSGCTSDMI
ncbi:hypothetical protein [Microcoleus asticus]|uniref:hypothetical protein n=1 Tax=Microcoleus asticus TaxID=2815231 RepID=UPI001552A5B1|nr:hypothetical protein [Microcoleus asticus]